MGNSSNTDRQASGECAAIIFEHEYNPYSVGVDDLFDIPHTHVKYYVKQCAPHTFHNVFTVN